MSEFGKIKKLMVDKPVFKLANKNAPVHYQLKPKGLAQDPAQVEPEVEEKPDNDEMRSMFSGMSKSVGDNDMIQTASVHDTADETAAKYAKLKEMMAARLPAQAKPVTLGPIGQARPRKVRSSDPVDDKQRSIHMIDSILNDGPDDVERILNELDNIDEYDLSDNDKRYVRNSVYEELQNQGRVVLPEEDEE